MSNAGQFSGVKPEKGSLEKKFNSRAEVLHVRRGHNQGAAGTQQSTKFGDELKSVVDMLDSLDAGNHVKACGSKGEPPVQIQSDKRTGCIARDNIARDRISAHLT